MSSEYIKGFQDGIKFAMDNNNNINKDDMKTLLYNSFIFTKNYNDKISIHEIKDIMKDYTSHKYNKILLIEECKKGKILIDKKRLNCWSGLKLR